METIAKRAARIRRKLNLSQTEVANKLNIKPQSIQALEAGKVRKPRFIVKLAEILEVTPEFLETGKTTTKLNLVRLMGKVGAGQAVYPIDDGGQELVEAPEGAVKNTVAIEVEGDSMLPHYPAGSILFYSRILPPMDRINKRSVVQLTDGRLLLKQLVKGTKDGFFTLLSSNAAPIEDVVVEWVAKIDWIKPLD